MTVCKENLQHLQDLQKQYYNKSTKHKSYTTDDKVWLNSKYFNTKEN